MPETQAEYITTEAEGKPIPVTFNLEPANYLFIRQWAASERRTYSAQMNIILDMMRQDMAEDQPDNAAE